MAAFSVFDVSFQQQQNDDALLDFASTCHSLCRQSASSPPSPSCMRHCMQQMVLSLEHLGHRFEEQQLTIQQALAPEEEDEEEDEEQEGDEEEEEEQTSPPET